MDVMNISFRKEKTPSLVKLGLWSEVRTHLLCEPRKNQKVHSKIMR